MGVIDIIATLKIDLCTQLTAVLLVLVNAYLYRTLLLFNEMKRKIFLRFLEKRTGWYLPKHDVEYAFMG